MDQPKKISEEPIANTVAGLDRFVVLANTTDPQATLMTVSANTVINTLGAQLPTYANNDTAIGANAQVGSLYRTTTGEVRIVV